MLYVIAGELIPRATRVAARASLRGHVAEGAAVTVEVSEDVTDPDASGVRLESVEVES